MNPSSDALANTNQPDDQTSEPSQGQPGVSSPRVHRAAGCVSTGTQIAGALSELVSLNQPGQKKTQGAFAMKFFQEHNQDEFDDLEQLAIIEVFYSERWAALYMSIERKQLRLEWL
ncbi:hypothetical protein PtB15_5B811 [Puccinia triticina]|nr:hypothetical protein PtB15_5B811 [Puccinia triticina]